MYVGNYIDAIFLSSTLHLVSDIDARRRLRLSGCGYGHAANVMFTLGVLQSVKRSANAVCERRHAVL